MAQTGEALTAERVLEATEEVLRRHGPAKARVVDGDAAATARAVFDATGRFHDPAYAGEWERPGVEAEFVAVVRLLLRGSRRRMD